VTHSSLPWSPIQLCFPWKRQKELGGSSVDGDMVVVVVVGPDTMCAQNGAWAQSKHWAQEVCAVTISMVITMCGPWPQSHLCRPHLHSCLPATAICFQAFFSNREFLPLVQSHGNDSDTTLNRLQMLPQWERGYTLK
jgi:hypothetical protein